MEVSKWYKIKYWNVLFNVFYTIFVTLLRYFALTKPESTDTVVLLEKRNPDYYEMFWSNRIRYFYKDKALDEIFEEINYFDTWGK